MKTFSVEIAKDLKAHQESKARRLDHATVLFCDIVSFTEASAGMSPEELVAWLNGLFSSFDRLTYQHGCEKIKTIGDAYMAAAGVPTPAADHAERVIKRALAIQKEAKTHTLNGQPLKLRIGINSGPVVAGVIGETRYAYDLWGDTVNTASRLESLCKPGEILTTESTKLQLNGLFKFNKISDVVVKGKGRMDVWELCEQSPSNKTISENKAA